MSNFFDFSDETDSLYTVQWSWQNEFGVAVLWAFDAQDARRKAEKTFGRGGIYQIEEVCASGPVVVIIDSRK